MSACNYSIVHIAFLCVDNAMAVICVAGHAALSVLVAHSSAPSRALRAMDLGH